MVVTPLQLAAAYAALVNGGTVCSPRIGAVVRAPDRRIVRSISTPVRDHLPISARLRQDIISAMAAGAFGGFPLDTVRVGGKTGTAQSGLDTKYDTSWFASFAGLPGTCVAVVTIPQAGQGAREAAPAVRAVWEGIYGVGQAAAQPSPASGRRP